MYQGPPLNHCPTFKWGPLVAKTSRPYIGLLNPTFQVSSARLDHWKKAVRHPYIRAVKRLAPKPTTEPGTFGLAPNCSNQLSYWDIGSAVCHSESDEPSQYVHFSTIDNNSCLRYEYDQLLKRAEHLIRHQGPFPWQMNHFEIDLQLYKVAGEKNFSHW